MYRKGFYRKVQMTFEGQEQTPQPGAGCVFNYQKLLCFSVIFLPINNPKTNGLQVSIRYIRTRS